MTTPRDYYALLGITKTANHDMVKKAYRSLAARYHPDHNKDAESEDKFKEITEAYAVLSDLDKRAEYDRTSALKSVSRTSTDVARVFSHFFTDGIPASLSDFLTNQNAQHAISHHTRRERRERSPPTTPAASTSPRPKGPANTISSLIEQSNLPYTLPPQLIEKLTELSKSDTPTTSTKSSRKRDRSSSKEKGTEKKRERRSSLQYPQAPLINPPPTNPPTSSASPAPSSPSSSNSSSSSLYSSSSSSSLASLSASASASSAVAISPSGSALSSLSSSTSQGKGQNLRVVIDVAWEEGILGCVKTFEFNRLATCTDCNSPSSIPKPESAPSTQLCHRCRNTGRVETKRQLSINVPQRIENASTMVIEGEGDAGDRDAPSGDLIVVFNVHELQREKLESQYRSWTARKRAK